MNMYDGVDVPQLQFLLFGRMIGMSLSLPQCNSIGSLQLHAWWNSCLTLSVLLIEHKLRGPAADFRRARLKAEHNHKSQHLTIHDFSHLWQIKPR